MAELLTHFVILLEVELKEFLDATESFGVDFMRILAGKVRRAFYALRDFIEDGIRMAAPSSAHDLEMRVRGVLGALLDIQRFRETTRNDEFHNHVCAVVESIFALNWITMHDAPLQFIRDMREAGEYYGNRVRTTHRGDELHVTWISKWHTLLAALERYVRQHHRTGFEWNAMLAAGDSVGVPPVLAPLSVGEQKPTGPPPPPPLPAAIDPEVSADRQQLMIQINQGPRLLEILHPVEEGESIRAQQGAVPRAQPAAVPRPRQPVVPRPQEPAAPSRPQQPAARSYREVFGLEGKKWRIEHQNRKDDLELQPNDKSETLAMFKCEYSKLNTRAKINAVSIDNCKRCIIILQDVISSVELIHCENVEVRCMGSCPNITVDNCDCVHVFLSEKSIDCQIITSKSTSTNINRLGGDGNEIEFPVPEQIRSVIVDGNLKSSVVEHYM